MFTSALSSQTNSRSPKRVDPSLIWFVVVGKYTLLHFLCPKPRFCPHRGSWKSGLFQVLPPVCCPARFLRRSSPVRVCALIKHVSEGRAKFPSESVRSSNHVSEAPADFSSELSPHQMAIRATRRVFVRAGLPSRALGVRRSGRSFLLLSLGPHINLCNWGRVCDSTFMDCIHTLWSGMPLGVEDSCEVFFLFFQQVELPGPVFATYWRVQIFVKTLANEHVRR